MLFNRPKCEVCKKKFLSSQLNVHGICNDCEMKSYERVQEYVNDDKTLACSGDYYQHYSGWASGSVTLDLLNDKPVTADEFRKILFNSVGD